VAEEDEVFVESGEYSSKMFPRKLSSETDLVEVMAAIEHADDAV
jgi:hypothetical protein